MWGRLASLGQNLQEFTKEVVNPTYESDEEQDEKNQQQQHDLDPVSQQPLPQPMPTTPQTDPSILQQQFQMHMNQVVQQLEKKHV